MLGATLKLIQLTMIDGFCVLLGNSFQANSTYLPNSMKQVDFTEEILALLWNLTQCNQVHYLICSCLFQRFFAYLVENEKSLVLTSYLLYQALQVKDNIGT